ncbi:hypothetical protein VP01_84g2 [Puccinia sorghi]|uniref:Reverse transcriptase Ty1/copia-type domain-containing protein n=1 Tax=Puccinia sorghi TaxID=27349 RepID=A0A0L6U9W2_9BASI|nr:hypothetical protein VP01_84g2 [Puccinia sorghi]
MRAIFNGSKIQKRFWHEVLKSSCLALNQIPRKGNPDSPWSILHGRKFPPNLLQPIGTPTIVLKNNQPKGRKFEPKGEEGILIGFNVHLRSYRVLLRSGQIMETKHRQISAQTSRFFESNCDPCLYICNDNVSLIFFHVDDLVLVGPGNDFEKQFEMRFKNSSCHDPNTILGMKFEKVNNKIKLSLPNHIEHGLEELGLVDCKISSTPLTPNLKLRDASDEDHARFRKLNINYRSAIGLLNHIAQLTRPDISFAVSSLARYSVKPGMTHWHEVKKVWQYLKGTMDLKLTLEIKEPAELLNIYSDASWGDDPQDRTSQSGYVCFLFGSIISWNSSKQRCVTYSSTEAELNPLVDSFHEGIWLKALLAEIWNIQMDAANHLIDNEELNERLMMTDEEFKIKFLNKHLIDNKGLDDKVKKFGSNPKTRHIDLKTKGIRQEVKHKNIQIKLISTEEMRADALTKAAPKSSVLNLSEYIDPDFKFS